MNPSQLAGKVWIHMLVSQVTLPNLHVMAKGNLEEYSQALPEN